MANLLDRLAFWRRPQVPAFVQPIDQGLMDLPLRRDIATQAALVRQTQVKESLGMAMGGAAWLDPDEAQYRRLTSGAKYQRRDLSPLQQDRMLEVTWFLWEQNPFARRLVTLMTDLILGQGVTVRADDDRVQEQIDLTWNHRMNRIPARLREFHNFLSLTGELILPVTRNPVTGVPVIGFIDPYQVKDIIPLDGNVLIPDQVVLKATPGQTQGQSMKIIRQNPATGRLEGDCFFFAINKLPNSLRGRSDLLPLADWLDLYDQYLFGEVERLGLLSAFVWDYKIAGADDPKIQQKLAAFPTPKPGTVFAHNENEELTARTPDLKAADRTEVAKLLRTHLAGSMGYPLSYLGDIDSNRATIEGQNDVAMKTPAARQIEFAGILHEIVQYTVESVTSTNPALYRDVVGGFKVNMPEIAAKDIARVGSILAQVVTANDTAIQNQTLSKKAAVTIQVALVKHLGIDLNEAELNDQIEDEAEERQAKADQIQAQMARTNPPVPGDDDQADDDDPDDPNDDGDDPEEEDDDAPIPPKRNGKKAARTREAVRA